MKLITCHLICDLIFFLILNSDLSQQTHVIEASTNHLQNTDSNISVILSNDLPTETENQINHVSKPTKKRKRRRRKKKIKVTSTSNVTSSSEDIDLKHRISPRRKRKRISTTTPPLQFSTTSPSSSFLELSSTKRVKKRRRKLRKKQNIVTTTNVSLEYKKYIDGVAHINQINSDYKKSLSEVENLVFPIWRNGSLRAPTNKSKCTKFSGGCEHICLPKGKCDCFKGYKLNPDGKSCMDIDECAINNGDCQMNCTNTLGSHRCNCPSGLRLRLDMKSCEDINECRLRNGHGPCQDTCENTFGGYKCNCNHLKGTKLSSDLHNCIDLDECTINNGGCSHICINVFGRSFCSCSQGMALSLDFKTCKDIDECEFEEVKKSCPHGCMNTIGSYRCLDIFDIQNDDGLSDMACKPLFPPENGYYKCSRKHAVPTYTTSGRRRIKNSIGTRCSLICPDGYKRVGKKSRVTCGISGAWIGNLNARCVSSDYRGLSTDLIQSNEKECQ